MFQKQRIIHALKDLGVPVSVMPDAVGVIRPEGIALRMIQRIAHVYGGSVRSRERFRNDDRSFAIVRKGVRA